VVALSVLQVRCPVRLFIGLHAPPAFVRGEGSICVKRVSFCAGGGGGGVYMQLSVVLRGEMHPKSTLRCFTVIGF
jgi:hypothetical protein